MDQHISSASGELILPIWADTGKNTTGLFEATGQPCTWEAVQSYDEPVVNLRAITNSVARFRDTVTFKCSLFSCL